MQFQLMRELFTDTLYVCVHLQMAHTTRAKTNEIARQMKKRGRVLVLEKL